MMPFENESAAGQISLRVKEQEMEEEIAINKPEYKTRMRLEYRELKRRYNKLHKMIVKYEAGTLDFTPDCKIDIMKRQAAAMGEYLYILEIRAEIENIDL